MRNVFKPVATTAILIACVLIFFYQDLTGDVYSAEYMAAHGGLNWRYVIYDKQYYRLITCMFIHYGMEHLANNMLSLYCLGMHIEQLLGKLQFCILYFGSGIIASIVSMVYNMSEDTFVISAGASGAIFGLLGALLTFIIFAKLQGQPIHLFPFVISIFLSLYAGFTDIGVDNSAHIAGFVSGIFLTTFFICMKRIRGGKDS